MESQSVDAVRQPGVAPKFASFQDWRKYIDKTKNLDDLKSMRQILATLNDQKQYFDPVFDCFVFKAEDGDYVACVDTSICEKTPTTLADMPLLKDFSIGRQVAHFGSDTLLYFTVKILDEGNLLQIVMNCGSHGTHVAGIASAYYPPSTDCKDDFQTLQLLEDGNQNGVAPGAQIVSIKIADTTLKEMETNTALLCALNWTTKMKCDIVNYSFGMQALVPRFGRICTHLTQFVMHTDTAFVTSGGNEGPSLGSVGSPGEPVYGLIGVAPLLYPETMKYMYSQSACNSRDYKSISRKCKRNSGNFTTTSADLDDSTDTLPSTFTWGARGPSTDGDMGLTVAACGAAIADVASWERNAFDLLHGSSMSSPSVAGGLVLVMSALRQSELEPSLRVPYILWRAAIFACAKPLPHLSPLDQGSGLLQVRGTYDFLRDIIRSKPTIAPLLSINQMEPLRDASLTPTISCDRLRRFRGWRLKCRVSGPGCSLDNGRGPYSSGIWLRRGWLPFQHSCSDGIQTTKSIMHYVIDLEPQFCNAISSKFRRYFSLNVNVQVDRQGTTVTTGRSKPSNWLFISPFVMIANQGRTLPLIIDPNAFDDAPPENSKFHPPFQVHHTLVTFVNADSHQHEVLAYLPITIQLPAETHFDVDSRLHCFGLYGDFFHAQRVCRWFVRIPRNSTAGVLRLHRADSDGDMACNFTLSLVQPASSGSALGTGHEIIRHVHLGGQLGCSPKLTGSDGLPSHYEALSSDFVLAFAVEWASDCVEITLAEDHRADVPTVCRIIGRLEFHGLEVQPPKLVFDISQTYFPLSLRSNFGPNFVKFDFKSEYWIQPVRPISSRRSYRRLVAFEKGSSGLSGVYCLQLVYKFVCPFNTEGAIFDFRRLTSLLYEANIVQFSYHVYDDYSVFKGAGSYQLISSPTYLFKLDQGSHQLIATILYSNTMKISLLSKEPDALDKLIHYPLLIRWPLAEKDTIAIYPSNTSSYTTSTFTPQLTLEVSTSLSTLALADVDYEWIFSAKAKTCDNRRLCSNLSMSLTSAPGHLDTGECVTEVFGVVQEKFAPYVTPGSYFEGNVYYYTHRDLEHAVTLPFEVHVSSCDGVAEVSRMEPPRCHGAFNLCARDLWLLNWVAKAHFDLNGESNFWVSPYEVKSISKSAASQEGTTSNTISTKAISRINWSDKKRTEDRNLGLCHRVMELLSADEDALNTDRAAVWEAVNGIMTHLVSAATAIVPYEPLTYLLPASLSGIEGEEGDDVGDDEEGIGHIPLFVDALSAPTSIVKKVQRPSAVAEAKEVDALEKPLTRAQVVEVLCVYGRYLCEQIVSRKLSGRAVATLTLIIKRLQRLLSPIAKNELLRQPMKNVFDAEDEVVATTVKMSVAEVKRVKPLFNGFWLAQLFVLHPQMPLLEALTRLAFQFDSPTEKDKASERTRIDCACIAFPWLIRQLQRFGLCDVARHLQCQLPSRFPAFDYTHVISRPSTS